MWRQLDLFVPEEPDMVAIGLKFRELLAAYEAKQLIPPGRPRLLMPREKSPCLTKEQIEPLLRAGMSEGEIAKQFGVVQINPEVCAVQFVVAVRPYPNGFLVGAPLHLDSPLANKQRTLYYHTMDEGRKRVLAIVAGILVERPRRIPKAFTIAARVREPNRLWLPPFSGRSGLCERLITCTHDEHNSHASSHNGTA